MKIEATLIPDMLIERFAVEHGLTMEIHERPRPEGDRGRFYAHFKFCDVMENGCLVGMYGDGATDEDAIRNYAARISLRRIALNAYTPERREIEVPRLR